MDLREAGNVRTAGLSSEAWQRKTRSFRIKDESGKMKDEDLPTCVPVPCLLFLRVHFLPRVRHLLHFVNVLRPVVQCLGVEVRAVRPDEGVDFGVNFHLVEEFFIL